MTNTWITKILQWANFDEHVRAVILLGSRAKDTADEDSDYDFALFVRSFDPFLESDQWLNKIGNPLVIVNETIERHERIFPTRLVIFEDLVKVDFAFYPLDYHLIEEPCAFLLDKDGLEFRVQIPAPKKPTEEEFLRIVSEFWFEAFHVVKYLKRDDLWSIKFRMGIMEQFLLTMIEWNEQSKKNWELDIPAHGKNMKGWVSPGTWKEVQGVFARFDKEDSRNALVRLVNLFRRLAKETGEKLQYSYPQQFEKLYSE